MDISQLATLKTAQSQQRNSREQVAHKYLQLGYESLAQAGLSSDFETQKSHLLKSFDSFSMALRQQRQASEPYLGLACVMMVSDHFERAQAYLDKVLSLEPEHPEALALITRLDSVSNEITEDFEDEPEDFAAAEEFEAQYDQALKSLQILTQSLQMAIPRLGVTIDPRNYAQTQKFVANYQQKLESLKQQVQRIELELDTQELQVQILPLDSSLKAIVNYLNDSKQLIQLNQMILSQIESCEALMESLKAEPDSLSPTDLNSQLETYLDQSDRIADQIDQFEVKGYPISELVSAYESFVKKFDHLEELAEDLLAASQ